MLKRVCLISLALVLAFGCLGTYAATAPVRSEMAENVLGKVKPNNSYAYYPYGKTISTVPGSAMSADGYYYSYQYYVPVKASQTQGVLFLSSFPAFYFQKGLVYRFDVLVDLMYGGGQTIDLSECGLVFGRPGLILEQGMTLQEYCDSYYYVLAPKSWEHVAGTFYRLSFEIPFNTQKYTTYFESVTDGEDTFYKCQYFGFYDGNANNFNRFGNINLQCRCYYMYVNTTVLTEGEYLAEKEAQDTVDKEKAEAEKGSSEAIEEATEAVKDEYSGGLLNSIGKLVSVMSYQGTEASWTFPAITLPEIPGIMKESQLSSETDIDFASWVERIPEPVLAIVRALTTVALVYFCFKELWGVVQYVMTLKGGGDGNG